MNRLIPLIAILYYITAEGARFSLWSGSVKGGGASAAGMAGATTALADDFFGTMENPAGLALTVSSIVLSVSSAHIEDDLQSDPGIRLGYYTSGLAMPLGGFGANLGYTVPFTAISPTGEKVELAEYRLSVAKAFLHNRLSIGLGIAPTLLRSDEGSILKFRSLLGALYRFPRRILLGLTYFPASTFGPDPQERTFTIPHRLTLGTGWIPNRFFRCDLDVRWIARDTDTVRFHRPTETVGTSDAIQFHLGLHYLYLSLRQIHGRLYLGTYLENPRSEKSSRVHWTWGAEVNPWFLRFSAGMDTASDYRNFSLGLGIDVGDILRLLKLHPPEVQPPPGGFLPNPIEVSDDWLSSQLQDNPEEAFQSIGPELEDIPRSLIPKGESN